MYEELIRVMMVLEVRKVVDRVGLQEAENMICRVYSTERMGIIREKMLKTLYELYPFYHFKHKEREDGQGNS